MSSLSGELEIADRKLCFGLFCHSFALLRTASDPLFCHSEGAQATEESPHETLRLRLRVTCKKGVIPSQTLRINSGLRLRALTQDSA